MADSSEEYDESGRRKVQCRLCKLFFHRIETHLGKRHDGMTLEEYQTRFPKALVLSETAAERVKKAIADAAGGTDDEVVAEATKAIKATPKGMADAVRSKTSLGEKLKRTAKPAAPEAEAPVEDDGILRIGTAKLEIRKGLSAAELIHVPDHDPHWILGNTETETWEYIASAFERKENVLIVGPTGCGKSHGVFQLAATAGQPMRRINVHGDLRAADFLGDKTVDVDPASAQAVVRWVDGLLPECMRKGYWLLVDELDAAPPHVLFVLQAVLEKHRLTIPATGETIVAHENFRIVATANTLGRGDQTGLYTGTHVLNEAFLDRFGTVIQADYPRMEEEIAIIFRRSGLAKEDCRKMVELAREVRQAAERETVYCTFSTRRLENWAAKAVAFGNVKRAAKVAVLNRLDADSAKVVSGLVQRYWGS